MVVLTFCNFVFMLSNNGAKYPTVTVEHFSKLLKNIILDHSKKTIVITFPAERTILYFFGVDSPMSTRYLECSRVSKVEFNHSNSEKTSKETM